MNIDEKMTLLFAVENSGFKIRSALKKLDVPKTTYYRWRAKHKRFGIKGLKDKRPIQRNSGMQLGQKKKVEF